MSAFSYFTSVILNHYKHLYGKEKRRRQFMERYRELMLKLKKGEFVEVYRKDNSD